MPDQCFTVVKGNEVGKRIGIVKVGESGYYATHEPTWLRDKSIDEVEEFVNQLNKDENVTVAQRKAMEHGSMFGWETAAANPDHAINAAETAAATR